jgi:hypothetical protein
VNGIAAELVLAAWMITEVCLRIHLRAAVQNLAASKDGRLTFPAPSSETVATTPKLIDEFYLSGAKASKTFPPIPPFLP